MPSAIPPEMVMEIRRAFASGQGLRAIARSLGISHRTVDKYRPHGIVICACGKPLHTGLCKEKHALSPGMVSRALRQRGIDDGYRKPKPRSRLREATERFDFIFGRSPDWQKTAKRRRPSQQEHYGIIGEVHLVTRKVRPEYREDVRQEMILACFEGRITRAEIGSMVKPFVLREMRYWLGAFHSIYKSLDTLAGQRDGKPVTYLDLLSDTKIDLDDLWSIPTTMWWEKAAA